MPYLPNGVLAERGLTQPHSAWAHSLQKVRGPVLTVSQADEIDLELRPFFQQQHHRGQRRHAVKAPCVRAQGPKMKFIYGPVRIRGL